LNTPTYRPACFNAPIGLISLRLLIFALLLVGMSPIAVASIAPYTPASDDTVLQHVPTTTDPRVRQFEQLATQARRTPADRSLAITLSQAYIDYGRSTGDARFLGRALAPIEPWLDDTPVPADVLIVHATILQSRHQFDAARTELKTALQALPGNAQAWLTLATVDMVQGRFADARSDCVHATNTGGTYLAALCNGGLLSLTGHADKAYSLLGFVEQGGPQIPIEVSAYVQGLLADAALRLGKRDAAGTHFQRGLQLTPGDNFLLADYADFLLDDKRYADVIELLAPYTDSDTSFLRLVYARAALAKPGAVADIQAMADRFAAMDARGSHLYRREQAAFVLYMRNQPDHALTLAQENWQVQRAPQDVRVLLETSLAAGKPDAAQPALDFIQRSGLQDPIIDRLANKARKALAAVPRGLPTTEQLR